MAGIFLCIGILIVRTIEGEDMRNLLAIKQQFAGSRRIGIKAFG